jgi:hypothetical protein
MTSELFDTRPAPRWGSARQGFSGWYVLYHDAVGHNVRRAGDVKGAIRFAACLLANGMVVDQVGPMSEDSREAVIGPSEIRRYCATLPIFNEDATR